MLLAHEFLELLTARYLVALWKGVLETRWMEVKDGDNSTDRIHSHTRSTPELCPPENDLMFCSDV